MPVNGVATKNSRVDTTPKTYLTCGEKNIKITLFFKL
jgi:hypothetical protein